VEAVRDSQALGEGDGLLHGLPGFSRKAQDERTQGRYADLFAEVHGSPGLFRSGPLVGQVRTFWLPLSRPKQIILQPASLSFFRRGSSTVSTRAKMYMSIFKPRRRISSQMV